MLFMKGNPDAPRCGFSQKTVNLLREQDVDFGWFDILEDEAVRQGTLTDLQEAGRSLSRFMRRQS